MAPLDSTGDDCGGIQGQRGRQTARRTAEGGEGRDAGHRVMEMDQDDVPSGWAGGWRRRRQGLWTVGFFGWGLRSRCFFRNERGGMGPGDDCILFSIQPEKENEAGPFSTKEK
jgi:hypothetical protein